MNIKLKKNIGKPDRLVRLFFAIVFLLAAYWFASWLLLIAAAFVFFEVFMSWCLWYQIIGKNSCPIDKR